MPLRTLLIALSAGAAVYAGVVSFGPAKAPSEAAIQKAAVSPTAKAVPKKVSPSLSPLPTYLAQVTVSVTPLPTVVSPTPWPNSPSPTPMPSPTFVATQVPTPISTPAPAPARIVINEIAWMGTDASSTDEWIELFNPGTTRVDLAGWRLKADDGKPDIALSGTIEAGAFYLIERTDDGAVKDIPADLVTAFGTGLSNTGENMKLTDPSGSIVDAVVCVAAWYAGDNATKSTMERKDPLANGENPQNWATNDGSLRVGSDAAGAPIAGTPKYRNSSTPSYPQ